MKKKLRSSLSLLLALMMVVSLFTIVPITASAAEKELTETFNLGEYGHYDEDWEEVLADAHTGVNVTVAPTGNYIYVQDNCWFTHDDQWHEAIRVTVNNGDVIRKIVIKEYFYDCDTWRVCVNGRTIPGTKTTIDEDYNWVTFETVNAAQALIESPDGGLAEQLIVYYGDPVPTTHTVTWKNGDDVLKTEEVEEGETPSYTGEAPNKADGVCCNFTFAGWNDGIRTYSPDALPAVNGDVTYTAVFTDSPKDGYYKTTVDGHSVYSIVPLGDDIAGGETSPYFYVDNDTEYFRLTSLNNCKYF